MLLKANRLTPEIAPISSMNPRMLRLAFFSELAPPAHPWDEVVSYFSS